MFEDIRSKESHVEIKEGELDRNEAESRYDLSGQG
jgi:hypothetical protein